MRLASLLNTVIELSFYALVFFTPLIFNPVRNWPSYELFEWNKMIFVYGLTLVIVVAWAMEMVFYKKLVFKRTPFDLPLILFLGSQILATFFSIDRHVSIFGFYSRFHGGLLSLIAYILLYYALVTHWSLIKTRLLLKFLLASGLIVATYGILQKFGIDAHMWVQDVQARVFSTLGQPNWLAAYLAILLPISTSLHLFIDKKNNSKNNQQLAINNIVRLKHNKLLVLFLITSIFYACLLFTKSRSGFLAFWISNAIFWIFLLIKNPLKSKSHNSQLTTHNPNPKTQTLKPITFFLVFNISFLLLNFVFTTPFDQYNRVATIEVFQSTQEKSMVPPSRPAGSETVIDIGITDSSVIRQIVWRGAIDIVKANPLFGTGPETFAFAYYQNRPAAHNLTSEWDFLYNRAHNEFLNVAATSGLVGLGTYLLLIGAVLTYALKLILRTTNYELRTIVLALLAAYVSILITNFFGFSVVVIGLALYFIPAVVFAISPGRLPLELKLKITKLTIWQKLLISILAFAAIYFLSTIARFWLADSNYAKAIRLRRQGDYGMAQSLIKQAISLRPREPVFRDEHALISGSLSELALEAQDGTAAAELAKTAIAESQKALTVSPYNVNFWKTRTKILFMLAMRDPEFINNALDAILVARELAPTDSKISYNVAVIYGHQGAYEKAISELNRTIELKPDYRDAYVALSLFYEETGEIDKAKQALKLALQKINPDDKEIKERLGALSQD